MSGTFPRLEENVENAKGDLFTPLCKIRFVIRRDSRSLRLFNTVTSRSHAWNFIQLGRETWKGRVTLGKVSLSETMFTELKKVL